MGFDVTFHPIAQEEIRRYIFDVLDDSSLAEGRVNELAKNKAHRNHLLKLYRLFPNWKSDSKLRVNNTLGFATAICAGFLHPFWYARDGGISLLAEDKVPELKALFTDLMKIEGAPLAAHYGSSFPLLNGNESASGLIPADQVSALRKAIDSLKSKPGRMGLSFLETVMDQDAIAALEKVTAYCQKHNLGLIEACDIVVPISGASLTNSANMHAAFLNNL